LKAKESAARIMPNGRALLFASARDGGKGAFDIWEATRHDASGEWEAVTNFSPVNTPASEAFLNFTIDGRQAYLAADWVPAMNFDIYERVWERPVLAPTITLQGRITNVGNGRPVPASIVVESFSNRKPALRVTAQPATGLYSVTLPAGDSWSITVEANGFMFQSRAIDLRTLASASVTNVSVGLVPLEKGRTIVIDTIYFDPDSANLRMESRIALDRLAALLAANPAVKLLVKGHVAAAQNFTGDPRKLSEDRAKTVRLYLIGKGIAANRLESKGFGDSQPVADNSTEEGRARNRRTEFEIR
jgi:outer membrane protein OmpA-like peptidoglycan-associated protein